jgi:hypothetical protein
VSTSWKDVGLSIADSINLIANLVKAIGKTYDQIMYIGGDLQIKRTQARLLSLAETMSGVNSIKMTTADLMDLYLSSKNVNLKWTRVQRELLSIANKLDGLQAEVKQAGKNIIRISGLSLKDELSAALHQ